MKFKIYKHSVIATMLSLFGAAFIYGGIVLCMVTIFIPDEREDLVGKIVACILFALMGFGMQRWADRIIEKKAQKLERIQEEKLSYLVNDYIQREEKKMMENDLNDKTAAVNAYRYNMNEASSTSERKTNSGFVWSTASDDDL